MSKANKKKFSRARSIHRTGPLFWGWYVVFSSFVMLTLIYGARYSFGVFAGWLLDRVAPKWITTVSVLFTTGGFIAANFSSGGSVIGFGMPNIQRRSAFC
jgi:hypothetical protein